MQTAERLTCVLTQAERDCHPRIQVGGGSRRAKHGDSTADPEAAMSARCGRVMGAKACARLDVSLRALAEV